MNIRSTLVVLASLAAAPLVTGCIVVVPAAPAQSPMQAIAMDTSTPIQMGAGLSDGQPPRFRAGAAMAYWIWQGNRGEWHLRSTTSKQVHRFQGRLRPVGGAALSNARATRIEWNDRVRREGNDIVFDFTTQGGEDGFDFGVNNNACVEMTLDIDGGPHPKLIVLGKSEQSPASTHFIACP